MTEESCLDYNRYIMTVGSTVTLTSLWTPFSMLLLNVVMVMIL